jgi:hypothetical protein
MPSKNTINHAKKYIIKEVKKYAIHKKLLSELSNIYKINVLQDKPIEELVMIFNKKKEILQIFSDHIAILHDYIKLVMKTILNKHVLKDEIILSDNEILV